MKIKLTLKLLCFCILHAAFCISASAQGTAFTYQGRLNDGANPASGIYDLRFTIYDSTNNPGVVIAGPLTHSAADVSNGLFTVALDFGANVFTGPDRWLEIAVRTNGATAFTRLTPRQPLTASPYAILAGSISGTIGTAQLADGSVTAAKLANGAVGSAQLGTNAVQSFNIAPGAIGPTQLAKPPQSGNIASSSLTLYFNQSVFTVPFNPVFAATPNVTLSLEIADSGIGWQSVLYVKSRSMTSFTGFAGLPTAPLTVDGTSPLIGRSSLAAVNGNPAISYFANPDLKYVRASDSNGTSWNPPVTADGAGTVGEWNSLAVVNGNPAIAYYDGLPNLNLKYVRSADVNGAAWGTPVTVDSAGDVGEYPSLSVVNGNPAISYYDNTGDNLKYVRAADIGGTNWSAPITVDSAGNAGFGNSLAVVNGNPAISYGSSPGGLKYARATDASGAAWGAPVTVDTTGGFGDTSLAIVSGNPAISYYDAQNGRLKYVRATDASGATWGTPVIVDSTGGLSGYTSLTVVNGNPAISYYDTANGDLKFARASDAAGTVWGGVVTVDRAGNVGPYTSLKIVNGQPAISYLDQTNDDLRFIRNTNTTIVPFTINWIALEP